MRDKIRINFNPNGRMGRNAQPIISAIQENQVRKKLIVCVSFGPPATNEQELGKRHILSKQNDYP